MVKPSYVKFAYLVARPVSIAQRVRRSAILCILKGNRLEERDPEMEQLTGELWFACFHAAGNTPDQS